MLPDSNVVLKLDGTCAYLEKLLLLRNLKCYSGFYSGLNQKKMGHKVQYLLRISVPFCHTPNIGTACLTPSPPMVGRSLLPIKEWVTGHR